ncbi:MAG: peptidylprolyl isomerase [Gemmatimonadaceae bacterium]
MRSEELVRPLSLRASRRVALAMAALMLASCHAAHTPAPSASTVPLTNPDAILADAHAPASFVVRFETSQGDFRVLVHRDWAPLGADRFYALVQHHFFDEQRFFRVRKNFIAQFGLHPDPAVIAAWKPRRMRDDSARVTNRRGTLTYAFITADTRSTQIFINLADNARLDAEGFAPFGEIVQGVDVIDRLYAGYDESAGGGMRAGKQGQIEREGNIHLKRDFPLLDFIRRARLTPQ